MKAAVSRCGLLARNAKTFSMVFAPSAPDEADDLRPSRVRDGASRQSTRRACRLRMYLSHARAGVFEVDVFVPLDEPRFVLRSAHLRYLSVAQQRQEGFTGDRYLFRIRAHRSPPLLCTSP